MKLYIHTNFNEVNRQALNKHLADRGTLVFRNELSDENIQKEFKSSDIVLGNPPVKWFEAGVPNLCFWQLDSAGFDGYKHLKLNVPVCNLKDYFSIPCAETTVAGILAFYRKIDELALLKSQVKWVGMPLRFKLSLLTGKRVLILGAGSIGKAIKKMLMGFDCAITMMARSSAEADIFTIDELMQTLPDTDIVINCLPGSARGFFTKEMIAKLPKNAVFANIGRGATVDENALIKALQNKKLAGAVLDVTTVEPLPAESPLWKLENVILTQHSGGGQISEDEGKVKAYIENVERFLSSKPLLNQIDLARGY